MASSSSSEMHIKILLGKLQEHDDNNENHHRNEFGSMNSHCIHNIRKNNQLGISGLDEGKLIAYVDISKKGDIFHDLFRHIPHEMVAAVPHKVHDCELHEGERGAVGSVITWHYTHEGKKKTCKQIIESVNEENHTVVYKVIGGELGEIYKSFTIILHVEPNGDGQVFVWTFEFEKPDTSVPYPTSMMDYLCDLVKDLDAHNPAN